jgi:peptide/nickel transport system permease protein
MSEAAGATVRNALTGPGEVAAAPGAVRVHWVRRALRNRNVVVGASLLLILLLAAVLADRISTENPTRLHPADRLQPPGARHHLGTDEFGRDVYSLVIHGSRVSLLVGGVTMLLTSLGGIAIGLAAGFYRRLDLIVMRLMDGLMAFPAILLAIAFMAARGPGVWNVIVALSLVYMPRTALIIRSTVLSLRELDYVQAARALGRGDAGIACRHILPNCLAPLLVQSTFIFAYAVLAEAILGFLGVGVPPYVPSWGNVIASGKNVIREAFWVSLFPGVTLTIAGLSLNLLGDGLRDTLDPRLRVQ